MPNVIPLLARTMPGLPEGGWWLAPIVFLLLAAAAVIDARTARVPDPVIFLGLFITAAVQGFLADWPFAARNLTIGLIAGVIPYLINLAWYRFKKRDALGMGDAKWTILAVACFGPLPGAAAWVLGAVLALLWMAAARVARKPAAHIHFAPFLCAGLAAGIYWLRLR
jgi:prepilin signal peptidase PulO-like enzyme (type II secretory pathway)